MVDVAFVTGCAPLTSSFFSKTASISSSDIVKSARTVSHSRRCRAARPQPVAQVSPPGIEEESSGEVMVDIMQQFSLAVMGAYAAMSGISPAAAVPEALVETFKSKPVSLVHPVVMWVALGTCLYTFYLGYQNSLIRKSEPEKRKELIKGKFADRHFKISSCLFAAMTIATFSGMANTYARTNKLFPGPHLYAGLGLVALFSVMSSLVPYMQKGQNWARNAHFTLAFGAVGLFGWQAKSGMAIVGKLLGWS